MENSSFNKYTISIWLCNNRKMNTNLADLLVNFNVSIFLILLKCYVFPLFTERNNLFKKVLYCFYGAVRRGVFMPIMWPGHVIYFDMESREHGKLLGLVILLLWQ